MTSNVHQSYVFIHGLATPRSLLLTDTLRLHPAQGIPSAELALGFAHCAEDAAVLLLSLPRISSELQITADSDENRARAVWNSGWEALLLGATSAARVSYAIESNTSASRIEPHSTLRVMNYHLHGWRHEPMILPGADCIWLEENFRNARQLLFSDEYFMNAVHCMSSYWWHPHPRPQLALLWAGIEALFKIDSELSFRLSLLAAKFLEPDDTESAKKIFREVKNLYKSRSRAVHGSDLKGDAGTLVAASAKLLGKLIRRCVEVKSLPDSENLVI